MKPWFPSEADVGARARLDTRTEQARICLFAAVLLSVIAAIILPPLVGLKVDVMAFLRPLAILPSVAIVWAWSNWRGYLRLRTAAELTLTPLLLSLPILVFTYASMHSALPLQDARLEAWDEALGFRSLDFIAWLNDHGSIAYVLGHAYSSLFAQMVMLPLLLIGAGQFERAYGMTLGVLVLGVIGASVCMFFPAVGVYVHHGIPNGAFAHVPQSPGYFHVQLMAVRGDPGFVLDPSHAQGIVAFPSGHAAIAVLFAWAAWGVRWARWPVLALDAAMFVAAVPQGGHYVVDLIAGTAIAAAATLIATRLPGSVAGLISRSRSPAFETVLPPPPYNRA